MSRRGKGGKLNGGSGKLRGKAQLDMLERMGRRWAGKAASKLDRHDWPKGIGPDLRGTKRKCCGEDWPGHKEGCETAAKEHAEAMARLPPEAVWIQPETLETLKQCLRAAVPLWIERVRKLTETEREQRALALGFELASVGDRFLPGRESQGAAQAFNTLAEGLACLAFAPGGVRWEGLHFDAIAKPDETAPTAAELALLARVVTTAREERGGALGAP